MPSRKFHVLNPVRGHDVPTGNHTADAGAGRPKADRNGASATFPGRLRCRCAWVHPVARCSSAGLAGADSSSGFRSRQQPCGNGFAPGPACPTSYRAILSNPTFAGRICRRYRQCLVTFHRLEAGRVGGFSRLHRPSCLHPQHPNRASSLYRLLQTACGLCPAHAP